MIDALNAVLVPQLVNDATLQGLGFSQAYAVRVPQKTEPPYVWLYQPNGDSNYRDVPLETFGRVAWVTSTFLVEFLSANPNDDATSAADARVKALWHRQKPTISGYTVKGMRYGDTFWTGRTLPSQREIRICRTVWVADLIPN